MTSFKFNPSGKLTLKVAMGALFLATIPTAQAASSQGKILYAAAFKWSSGSNAGRPLQLVILKPRKPRYTEAKLVARIMDGSRIEAVCGIQNLETATTGKMAQPVSLDMSCKSAVFGALAAPATLYFRDAQAEATSRNVSVLRFGTWLQGYQQAVLTAEFDQSARLMREMKEMVRPGAEPVKLARAQ